MTETSGPPPACDASLVTRRGALAVAALTGIASVITACGRDRAALPPSAPITGTATGPASASDIMLVTTAIADEERLAAFYAATSRRYRADAALVTALAGRQGEHIARLRKTLTNLDPQPAKGHEPIASRPVDLAPSVAGIAGRARDAREAGCLNAGAGLLAELFASIAACHAVTVQLVAPALAPVAVPWPGQVLEPGALQPCLAAEHAAVYGYGLLGGVLSAGVSDSPVAMAATASYDVHRQRRDLLTDLIRSAGLDPAVAAAAYDVPIAVVGAASARKLAGSLESHCATVYARATAVTTTQARLLVSRILLDAARRAVRWGEPASAFPGLTVR